MWGRTSCAGPACGRSSRRPARILHRELVTDFELPGREAYAQLIQDFLMV